MNKYQETKSMTQDTGYHPRIYVCVRCGAHHDEDHLRIHWADGASRLTCTCGGDVEPYEEQSEIEQNEGEE